jgi:hypothetical protein
MLSGAAATLLVAAIACLVFPPIGGIRPLIRHACSFEQTCGLSARANRSSQAASRRAPQKRQAAPQLFSTKR